MCNSCNSENIYYAKSVLANGKQSTVKEHCRAVAAMAERFGAELGMGEQARTAGLFHDFGKYSRRFQKVLNGEETGIDHAVSSAAFFNTITKEYKPYQMITEVIYSHHGRLLEYERIGQALKESIKQEKPIETCERRFAALAGKEEYARAMEQFKKDNMDFVMPNLFQNQILPQENIERMLYTRMLYSCLVDADYTVSAAEETPEYLQISQGDMLQPQSLLQNLYTYQKGIKTISTAQGGVNAMRETLFEQCGYMGEKAEGLYTLTAPTGTGKTLALLHFALRHTIKNNKKRIIVVLPFLTLTEQNAGVYRNIYPDLLEDNSQSNLSEEQKELAARWSAPFIVTTSVRFFESLFSNRPTDCRKLHNIANSVVIFDEAQTLPADLTRASLTVIKELCRAYHTTVVLSTATQPDYGSLKDFCWEPTEIMPENKKMYKTLKRTETEWRITEKTPLCRIAEEMKNQNSVCCIVNLRKHAKKLFGILKEQCNENSVFFITTDLCAEHRKDNIDKINTRLKNNLPCRVVATQCIEAGVDFDFDVMYRALAPLDSIVQAAGRCNRNGRLSGGGRIIVFIPDEEGGLYPGQWYDDAANKVVFIAMRRHKIEIDNPEHLKEYYQLLFMDAKDKVKLSTAVNSYSYEDTAKEYKLIQQKGYTVLVPYPEGDTDFYDTIYEQLLKNGITGKQMKQYAGMAVAVYANKKEQLENYAEPVYIKHNGKTVAESGYYVLRPQYKNLYTADMGLIFPMEELADECSFV